ncbi:MAG: RNA polymerase sigma factor [Pseudomonadales bacterium]|nr:RNA polymerase sigma factor [Pseudomonadales bacterium]
MRRFCGDNTLADYLAQQVFLQVWLNIGSLKKTGAFGGWLKRIAVSVWLQHRRRHDTLLEARELADDDRQQRQSPGTGMDLDHALAMLSEPVRMCIVLSYQAGLSHPEIADVTDIPLGTVKSHITRGTRRLREVLGDYRETRKAR